MFMISVGCPVLVPPLNGIANITSDGIISRSMFQCDLGTSLQGHSTSICGADGQWNSTVPECGRFNPFQNDIFFTFPNSKSLQTTILGLMRMAESCSKR